MADEQKPVAYMGPQGQLMLAEIFDAWAKVNPEQAKMYVPLFKAPSC